MCECGRTASRIRPDLWCTHHIRPAVLGTTRPCRCRQAPRTRRHASPQFSAGAISSIEQPGIWQGLNAGLNGGYNFGNIDDHTRRGTLGLNGTTIGGHIGYNWQTANWVLGAEFDANWADADSRKTFSGPVTVDARNDWLASARLRAGYTFNNIFLLYVTGGAAFGNYDVGVTDALGTSRAQEALFGYVIGGGLDVKLTQNISGRVEALYYDFDDKAFAFPGGRTSFDTDVTAERAGLTYHFN